MMECGGRQMMGKGTGTVYRIVVRSELNNRYAVAFEGMEMKTSSGRTVLTGEIKDEPHLHGILDRIGALGLRLVSVEDLSESGGDAAFYPSTADREAKKASSSQRE
jgi:hypothetical protein